MLQTVTICVHNSKLVYKLYDAWMVFNLICTLLHLLCYLGGTSGTTIRNLSTLNYTFHSQYVPFLI